MLGNSSTQQPTHPDVASSHSDTPPNKPLQLGVDYYIENGYWVFTEHFLRERGYCCGSGCRHCPYRKKAEQRPDNVDKHQR